MKQLIEYIPWICYDKRLWSLEPIHVFRKCHYRKKNKFEEIRCQNPNCNGEFPNQEQRESMASHSMVKTILKNTILVQKRREK